MTSVSCDNDTVPCVGVPLYDSKSAISVVPTDAVVYARPTWNDSVCHGVVSEVCYEQY